MTAMERNAIDEINFSARNSDNLNFFLRDSFVNTKEACRTSFVRFVFATIADVKIVKKERQHFIAAFLT